MEIKIYKDDRKHFRDYYQLIRRLKDIELAWSWMEITDREFWFLLECVVPVRMTFGIPATIFMSGEPICDNCEGTLYYAVAMVDGRCFRRPAVLELYNPAAYICEIRWLYFSANKYPGRES